MSNMKYLMSMVGLYIITFAGIYYMLRKNECHNDEIHVYETNENMRTCIKCGNTIDDNDDFINESGKFLDVY